MERKIGYFANRVIVMGKKENQKAFFNDKVCTTIFNWLYGVVSIGSVVGFFLLVKYVDEVLG